MTGSRPPGTLGDVLAACRRRFVGRVSAVTLSRFVIDGEVYQEPSPAMNATPVLAIQRYLQTPNLAWEQQ